MCGKQVLRCASMGLMLFSILSVVIGCSRAPQQYMGRATVMWVASDPKEGIHNSTQGASTSKAKHDVQTLARLAASTTVMQRSAETMNQLGITVDASSLLKNTRIHPVDKTDIIQIEVISISPEEAKAAADIITAEFRRFYSELYKGDPNAGDIKVVEPAYAFPVKRRFGIF